MGLRTAILSEGNKTTQPIEFNRFFMVIFILTFILISSIIVINTQVAAERADDSPEIDYLKIETEIDNNYAITEIHEMIRNPYNYSIDETFSFEIPQKAFISNFSLTIGNDTYYAEIVPKDVGQQKYEEAVINGSDAGLVEASDKNIFSYSVSLSPYQEILVGLRYEQFLEKSLGGYEYVIPFSSGTIEQKVNSFSIEISLKSRLMITSVSVENYRDEAQIDGSAYEVEVTYQTSSSVPTADFIVTYEIAAPPINGTMLNYNDGTDEFFFHIFSPQRDALGGGVMAKEIIFVLDKSGSMAGEKIAQLKVAFGEIINQLRTGDTFNIVMFDSTIMEYKTELIGVSSENKTEATNYINNIAAGGSTNINDALTTALDMFEITETKVPIIVMLTDGLPTAGVTNTHSIRENIRNKNTAGVAIFCLGFGFDVDFEFLKAMSLENYGIAIRIYEGEDASEQITDFYDTISTPLLKGLIFSYPSGAHEVYPTKVDQLFEGAEVVVVGKYAGENREIMATVDGTSWEGGRTFKEIFQLEDDTNHTFIPRFWAYAKIMYLLDEIAISGENESLVENVTDLALEYGFVTPYTSLLVEINNEPKKEDPEPEPVPPPYDNSGGNTSTNSMGPNPKIILPLDDDSSKDSDNDGVPDDQDYAPLDPDQYEPNPIAPDNNGNGKDGPQNDEYKETSGEEPLDSLAISWIPLLILILIVLSLVGYSKIKRHKLLQQKRREMIYKHINENPGEHFRGIQKALGLEVGVVAYHLNKLERGEFIKSRQDGQKRRFYPMSAKIDVKLILSQLQEQILNWIKSHPGMSGSSIADNLGMNRKVINYHVKILQSAGFIYVEKQGREALCYSAAGI